jgi:hypothetical protein
MDLIFFKYIPKALKTWINSFLLLTKSIINLLNLLEIIMNVSSLKNSINLISTPQQRKK